MSVNIFVARPFSSRKVYMLLNAMRSDEYSWSDSTRARWEFSQCDRTFYLSGPGSDAVVQRLCEVYPGHWIAVK